MAFGFGGKKKKDREEKVEREATIKIHFDGETHEFTMKADKNILDEALDRGIDLPYSCQSGLCTSCMCRKVSGEVEMEDADGLGDDEIEQGFVLICVGRPASDFVELEVD